MREPIHPGETLREDLDAPGMSAAELARRIEVPGNRITELFGQSCGVLRLTRAVGGWTPTGFKPPGPLPAAFRPNHHGFDERLPPVAARNSQSIASLRQQWTSN